MGGELAGAVSESRTGRRDVPRSNRWLSSEVSGCGPRPAVGSENAGGPKVRKVRRISFSHLTDQFPKAGKPLRLSKEGLPGTEVRIIRLVTDCLSRYPIPGYKSRLVAEKRPSCPHQGLPPP